MTLKSSIIWTRKKIQGPVSNCIAERRIEKRQTVQLQSLEAYLILIIILNIKHEINLRLPYCRRKFNTENLSKSQYFLPLGVRKTGVNKENTKLLHNYSKSVHS